MSAAARSFMTAALVFGTVYGFAADPPTTAHSVEELRQILSTPAFTQKDLETRRRAIGLRLDGVRKPAELCEALLLAEWRDGDVDQKLASVDRSLRAEVARRLEAALTEGLQRSDPVSRTAAARIIAELALPVRVRQPAGWRLRGFAPVLADLALCPDPALRLAAVDALSRIGADPGIAAVPLGHLLRAEEITLRRAAANAILNLIETEIRANEAPSGTACAVLHVCKVVLPLASHGLSDSDIDVRSLSVQTFHQSALAADRILTDERITRMAKPEASHMDVRALADVWHARSPALTIVLNDSDPHVRRLALQAVESMARVARLIENQAAFGTPADRLVVPPSETLVLRDSEVVPTQGENMGPAKPLLGGLQTTLPSLAAGVNDPDVFVRRATVDAMELFGEMAKPESPSLVQALGDHDLFVRWTAARTLGSLAPTSPEDAVPALTRLLDDVDMDVRYAAAESLRRYGPAARDAAPALVVALGHPDPETRLAAMRALQGIGVSASAAIPALVAAMTAPEARVREAAAQFLAQFGPAANDSVESLRAALNDADSGVRRAAGDALLDILSTSQEKSPITGQPTSPIWRVTYLSAPAPALASAIGCLERHIIATTPPPVTRTIFAADSRSPIALAAWRPAIQVAPSAILLPPAGARGR